MSAHMYISTIMTIYFFDERGNLTGNTLPF